MSRELQIAVALPDTNRARADYETITVRPLSGALGAEISGVDLAAPLDQTARDEIHDAFLRHHVIVFRDQTLAPGALKAFAARFGPFYRHPYFSDALDGHKEITVLRKEATDTLNIGGAWHSDATFEETPPKATMLYAVEVPAHGGDTLFANLHMAFALLSDGMRRMLGGLKAVHSAGQIFGQEGDYATAAYRGGRQGTATRTGEAADRAVEHPVIRTHPETGAKALWVNRSFTTRFAGMSARESAPLLEFLFAHAALPDVTARVHWRRGTLALWDNRSVHHYALNDYFGQTRVMHRLTIAGDRPV